jgi:hypothetical protein
MEKLDLAKIDKAYYAPPARPVEVNFGPLPYLAVTGRGAPQGAAYTEALEALYPLAYAVKFASKAAGRDFTVAKLEGQWWWSDEWAGKGPEEVPRDVWEWTLRLRLPPFIDAAAVAEVRTKASAVRWELLDEGPCVQILHVGPYAAEPATLAMVHEHLHRRGLTVAGLHHEIYLTDPRKGDPAMAKTILRLPVR